jgi:DNA replication protein DnaC
LLIALGTEAAMAGYRVKSTQATKLVNELVDTDEMMLSKTIARYGRVELLRIDELGYMALDKRGAELLCQVLTEREEKNSVAITSNESFSGWTKTFTDPRLCAQSSTGSPKPKPASNRLSTPRFTNRVATVHSVMT